MAFISIALVLKIPIHGTKLLPEQQKHTVLLQTYILTWLLLIPATVAAGQGVGGLYFVSVWNVVLFLGCALASIESMFGAYGTSTSGEDREGHRFVHGVRFDAVPQHEDEDHRATAEHSVEPANAPAAEAETETTPLLQQRHAHASATKEDGGAIGWWILQLLVVVPAPVILFCHISLILLGNTQTLADGSSAVLGRFRAS